VLTSAINNNNNENLSTESTIAENFNLIEEFNPVDEEIYAFFISPDSSVVLYLPRTPDVCVLYD
jgi:hypothetical protein